MNYELVSTYICISFQEGTCDIPLFYQKHIDHIYPLWCGMWTRRSLWNPKRKQNIFWVGYANPVWWILGEKYFLRLIHWRSHGSRKGYLWGRVQFCILWGKEEVLQQIFSIPGSSIGMNQMETPTQIFVNIDGKPIFQYRGADIEVFHLSQQNYLTLRSSWLIN